MRTKALAMLAAAILAGGGAVADERYDRKLDEAAADIAAARMGALRGGFQPGERPVLFKPAGEKQQPSPPQAAAPGVWHDGLAIAVERKTNVSPEL